jgi:hypothetical protein
MDQPKIDLAGTANACPFCSFYHSMVGVASAEDCERASAGSRLVPLTFQNGRPLTDQEVQALGGMFVRPCG